MPLGGYSRPLLESGAAKTHVRVQYVQPLLLGGRITLVWSSPVHGFHLKLFPLGNDDHHLAAVHAVRLAHLHAGGSGFKSGLRSWLGSGLGQGWGDGQG